MVNSATVDAEVAACDLVIEAVVENPEVQPQLYARLEPLMESTAILRRTHPTIPITKLAERLKRPEQFCGIHFFNPVRKMQLVEVIRGEKTSDETIATAVAYAKKIGKSPIVVNDGPGFFVNRLLLPYMNESLEMLSRRSRDPGHRAGGEEFRHADGADHAVRHGRLRHGILRRARDV